MIGSNLFSLKEIEVNFGFLLISSLNSSFKIFELKKISNAFKKSDLGNELKTSIETYTNNLNNFSTGNSEIDLKSKKNTLLVGLKSFKSIRWNINFFDF